ncbi:hypothetical protein ACGFJT_36835 [Actinomadura geliboluensis]|uniref:hypothetical protein n=1 Tax=Actinomadura geliboluensis TaxID=882440 RepID=UPI0037207411
MREIKLTDLTNSQSAALSAALDLIKVEEGEELKLTATTATFRMEQPRLWLMQASEALRIRDGSRGGHYKVLHAVHRKLNKAITGQGGPKVKFIRTQPQHPQNGPSI